MKKINNRLIVNVGLGRCLGLYIDLETGQSKGWLPVWVCDRVLTLACGCFSFLTSLIVRTLGNETFSKQYCTGSMANSLACVLSSANTSTIYSTGQFQYLITTVNLYDGIA